MSARDKKSKIDDDDVKGDAIYADEPFALPPAVADVELSYPNKLGEKAILAAVAPKFLSVGKDSRLAAVRKISPNALLYSDNFFGLRALANDLHGKVNLIYTDPPFATGTVFHSRKQEHAYEDRFGPATYVEFMRRRLILMRELLAADGSIYLHIGHQMLFHLKMTMDEVFGRNNFRNLIVRKKCSSKNYTKHQYPNLNDYILFYSKSKNWKWNSPGVKASEEWVDREYGKVDEKGRFKLVPIHAPGIRNGETGKEWRGMQPPTGKHWQLTPAKLDELDKNGEIHWSKNGNPRRKVYLGQGKELALTDYWDQFRDAHHQSIAITGYPTEKNLDMLRTIVSASSETGDLILDPFSGSGTTLHAANESGRKWIGIDESLTAIEATVTRLRHGMQPMGDFVQKKADKVLDLFGKSEADRLIPTKKMTREAVFSLLVDEELPSTKKEAIVRIATS